MMKRWLDYAACELGFSVLEEDDRRKGMVQELISLEDMFLLEEGLFAMVSSPWLLLLRPPEVAWVGDPKPAVIFESLALEAPEALDR